MNIILLTLAVAFTAVCVWLTVRIVNRREKWPKWTLAAVVVAAMVVYVAGFGPLCWIHNRTESGGKALAVLYRPFTGLLQSHRGLGLVALQYAQWGASDGYLLDWDSEDGPVWIGLKRIHHRG